MGAAEPQAKFIKRVPRTSSTKGSNPNLYDFSDLVAAAQPFALEELQDNRTNLHEKYDYPSSERCTRRHISPRNLRLALCQFRCDEAFRLEWKKYW